MEDCKVRILDAPEWVAVDVCDVLGIGNPSETIKRFKQSERGISITDTNKGPREVLTVTEPGLYRLIFKSRKPDAPDGP
jgi:prophage antirepressor-like protein